MKKLALVCGILVGVVSVSLGKLSEEELDRNYYNCIEMKSNTLLDKFTADSACEALINHGLELGWGLENCDKEDSCDSMGDFYFAAGRYREAIPYYEKAIAFGTSFVNLGNAYIKIGDYYSAKKYLEIGCGKANDSDDCRVCCHNLGALYRRGEGVRQDYAKAVELYKKACDLKWGMSCSVLGSLYETGGGVRQNYSTAKQYFGRACDLGYQMGCDNYKRLNEMGIQ